MILLWCAVLAALLAAELVWSNASVTVTRYTIENARVPDNFQGYRILQISDLHSRSFGPGNRRLLRDVRKADPDIIVLTGDMVSWYESDFSVFLALASDLAAEYDVYYIPGNHEEGLWAEQARRAPRGCGGPGRMRAGERSRDADAPETISGECRRGRCRRESCGSRDCASRRR